MPDRTQRPLLVFAKNRRLNCVATVNYYWRIFASAFCYTLFGVGGVLVPIVATPVIWLSSRNQLRRRRMARRLVQRLFKVFIYVARWVGVLSWDIDGVDRLREEGILVVANHPTLLDVVFLVAFTPNADCIVKRALLKNPAMKGFVSLTGYIVNDGGAQFLEDARHSLVEGSALIIFPEGTRTRPGEPLRFQRGAANILVRCRVNPTPVVITCRPETLSKEHRWYHIPPRRFHMSLQVKEKLDVQAYFAGSKSLAARKLTTYLERFYTGEITTHVDGSIVAGIEATDH